MLNWSLRNKISMSLHFLCRVCTASCSTGQDVTSPLCLHTIRSYPWINYVSLCAYLSHTPPWIHYPSQNGHQLILIPWLLCSRFWGLVYGQMWGSVNLERSVQVRDWLECFVQKEITLSFLCSSLFTVYIPHDYSEYHDLPLINIHDTFWIYLSNGSRHLPANYVLYKPFKLAAK